MTSHADEHKRLESALGVEDDEDVARIVAISLQPAPHLILLAMHAAA
jgi:hypothetical protein